MKPWLLGVIAVCASCAPPGYMYDVGSFTPRPIDSGYPPNPPRHAQASPQPIRDCLRGQRAELEKRLVVVREKEDRAKEKALRDDSPDALKRFNELAEQDRDIQDQINAPCFSN